jgi:hypothetical protein
MSLHEENHPRNLTGTTQKTWFGVVMSSTSSDVLKVTKPTDTKPRINQSGKVTLVEN